MEELFCTESGVCCVDCGTTDVCVDENGLCEACYLTVVDASYVLCEFEEVVILALEALTPEQLLDSFEMSLTRTDGPLQGTRLRRSTSTCEGGVWEPAASSAFEEAFEETCVSNVRCLRRATGLSLDQLATQIGASVQTLALWEQGALPAADDPVARRLCDLLGCRWGHVFGLDEAA